jgi:hypothetical protein
MYMKNRRALRVGWAFSVVLALGLCLLGPETAEAQSTPLVSGTYSISQNFWEGTLVLNQSGTTIWGSLTDSSGRPDYVFGYLSGFTSLTTINFTRYGPDFTQTYVGQIVPGRCLTFGCPVKLFHGTFNHNGSGTYGWYAAR